MPLEDLITLGTIAVNILLTLVLIGVYFKNYRTISSKMTLGLLLFAIAFLAENVLDLFFYNIILQQGIFGMTTIITSVNLLQLAALAVLLWVTWK